MTATAISLFSGAGGCSYGFKEAGYSILYANDNDSSAVETYKKNFPTTLCEMGDISELNFTELMKKLGIRKGELDILIGGPPCQGFSTAGTRFWDDPRNYLLKKYTDGLAQTKPKWFVMENVEGLLTSNKGRYVYEAAKAFVDLGYRIRIEKVYAHEFGVPQRRKRVLIVGNRLGLDFELPKAAYAISGPIFRNSKATLRHALEGLPKPTKEINGLVKASYAAKDNAFLQYVRGSAGALTDHYTPALGDLQTKRASTLKPGQTMKDLPAHLQHESFRRRANRRVSDGTPTEKRGGSPSGLKRLVLEEPSLTITGAAIREFIHPFEDRPLTIREAARIQTFSDDFIFCGNLSQKIQQIGNAIPPKLAEAVALHIKDSYGFERADANADGKLLGICLTKSDGMSPALKRTEALLVDLMRNETKVQQNLW